MFVLSAVCDRTGDAFPGMPGNDHANGCMTNVMVICKRALGRASSVLLADANHLLHGQLAARSPLAPMVPRTGLRSLQSTASVNRLSIAGNVLACVFPLLFTVAGNAPPALVGHSHVVTGHWVTTLAKVPGDVGFQPAPQAPLGNHVVSIVSLGSQEQVRNADAIPNIASVKDAQSVWNWSVGEFPGNSMGTEGSLCFELSVSSTEKGTSPKPASIRVVAFGNVLPKPFFHCPLGSVADSVPSSCAIGLLVRQPSTSALTVHVEPLGFQFATHTSEVNMEE